MAATQTILNPSPIVLIEIAPRVAPVSRWRRMSQAGRRAARGFWLCALWCAVRDSLAISTQPRCAFPRCGTQTEATPLRSIVRQETTIADTLLISVRNKRNGITRGNCRMQTAARSVTAHPQIRIALLGRSAAIPPDPIAELQRPERIAH